VILNYGLFMNTILDFFIIALSIFVTLKIIKKLDHTLDDVKDKIRPLKDKKNEEGL